MPPFCSRQVLIPPSTIPSVPVLSRFTERSAAVAAQAAITAQSEETSNTFEEEKRANANDEDEYAPEQQLLSYKRRKGNARISIGEGRSAGEADGSSERSLKAVESPSLIDRVSCT
jgi:hypothetical protein